MYLGLFFWAIVGVLVILTIVGAFIVLFLVVARFEKIHIDDFVPAPDGEPPLESRYFTEANESAKRLGFVAIGIFTQNRDSRNYRARLALWVSPEQDILMQIVGGKTMGVPIRRTILVSVISSNQIIQTQDRVAAADLSGFTDQEIFIDADLDELLSFHRERLASWPGQKRVFSEPVGEWKSIHRTRAKEIVRIGLAKFLNPEQSIYRHTSKGAWLQFRRSLLGPIAQAANQTDQDPQISQLDAD